MSPFPPCSFLPFPGLGGAPPRSLKPVSWGASHAEHQCPRILAPPGLVKVPACVSTALRATEREQSRTPPCRVGPQLMGQPLAKCRSQVSPLLTGRARQETGVGSSAPSYCKCSSPPWPGGTRETQKEYLHTLVLNLLPPNPRWGRSIQIPSRSRLVSTMLVSLCDVSALPPATMIQKWIGGFLASCGDTTPLPWTGHHALACFSSPRGVGSYASCCFSLLPWALPSPTLAFLSCPAIPPDLPVTL